MALQVLIEACVERTEEARAVVAAGAGRVELCSDLDVGGLTPEPSMVRATIAGIDEPVFVMVRPRAGDFCYTRLEFAQMEASALEAIDWGAAGLVFGLLTPDGRIDGDRVRRLVSLAGPVPTTFHKAFDEVRDLPEALEMLIDLGVKRILTSGGHPTAVEGSAVLAGLAGQARGRIGILVGGGVRGSNAQFILKETGVSELHARGAAIPALAGALADLNAGTETG